ncbi:hypothetical protein [Bifidobacterium indicum]|uniref:hypothetical protein n=1 Tax=Bifidobacterium indicum TaxID=1691 RepID=UPI0030D8F53F
MVWFKVDDRLPMNRKMAGVSLAAVGLWVEGGSWASGAQTGGTIPKQLLRLLHVESSEKQADELVAAGLWEDEGDQWRIHDFFDYNPTAKEIEDLKASRSKAGRSGGLKSGESRRSKREANREAKSKQNRSKPRSKNEAVPVPVPYISTNVDISPKPPTGVESDEEQIREPSSEPTVEFTQFWSLYPNHDYEDAAVREFRRVRRQRVSLPALLQGAQMLRDEHRDPRYIPAASKWLHDGGWKNKPKPKQRAPASSPGMSKSQQNLLHNQQVVERIIAQERAGTMQDTGRRELTT